MTSASSAPAPASGEPDVGPAPRALPRGWLVLGLFGCLFLAAAPAHGPAPTGLLGTLLAWQVPIFVLRATNSLLSALAVYVVWLTLVEAFAVPAGRALASAALYGLGTALLPYSKVPSWEPLQSLGVALVVHQALTRSFSRAWPACVLGLLVLVRPLMHGSFSPSHLPESLRELFVSPAQNLLVFNPVLALAVAGALLPMAARRRWLLLAVFAIPLVVFGLFRDDAAQPSWGPRHAMVLLPALVPFIAVVLGWIQAQPTGQRIVLNLMVTCIALASFYVQILGASFDFAGPREVCAAYEKLRIDGALPECGGDDISASMLAVHHYLLWRVPEHGPVPELPWVAERSEPTLAERIFAHPGLRERARRTNWLFFDD
jgi:hypothetical protein